jgi:hypothetical protein
MVQVGSQKKKNKFFGFIYIGNSQNFDPPKNNNNSNFVENPQNYLSK